MRRFVFAVLAVSLLFTMLLSIAAGPAFADGAFFALLEYDIFQPSQKAIILYENNREDLILAVKYEGNADEFAWVIPVPNYPDIDVSDPDLFWELSQITTEDLPVRLGCARFIPLPLSPAVEVLERTIISPYDVAILSAQDPTALVDWLNSNGYSFPEEGEKILDDYITKEWYFVATRINTEEEATGLEVGTIEPLKLSFESDEIIYPLRITSLSSKASEVLLYVFADQKVVPREYQFLSLNVPVQVLSLERKGNVFYLEFGEEIRLQDLWVEDWLVYESLYELLSTSLRGDEYYLTKLRAEITSGDMVDIDLIRYDPGDYLDSDGDGWSDAEEAIAGTNPNRVDTDYDRIRDPQDDYPLEIASYVFAVIIITSLVVGIFLWRRYRRRKRAIVRS
ncbi:MAG: DUF2330 domain-containing protein [Desulfobacteraceae bacterium]|nr:DUF2330 domain-containing protein [Desulfobacteraceae bacterium]